jgi:N-acetylmuramoyl-L-alanine amidase
MVKGDQSKSISKPPIVTRTDWDCPDGQITNHGTLSYTAVTHLIVHHTVNDNDAPDWGAVVLSIWNFHVFDRGFADIGYNYLIDPNGVIYEGRSGGDDVQGAHFSGVNAGTMGIGMLGTFTYLEPTREALLALEGLLAWKCDQRRLDPIGSSVHAASQLDLSTISGHRDGPGTTECPGEKLYGLLPEIRSDVNRMLNHKNHKERSKDTKKEGDRNYFL